MFNWAYLGKYPVESVENKFNIFDRILTRLQHVHEDFVIRNVVVTCIDNKYLKQSYIPIV